MTDTNFNQTASMILGHACTQEVRIVELESQIAELSRYFTSGNGCPVERATIKAEDFWRIVGQAAK